MKAKVLFSLKGLISGFQKSVKLQLLVLLLKGTGTNKPQAIHSRFTHPKCSEKNSRDYSLPRIMY